MLSSTKAKESLVIWDLTNSYTNSLWTFLKYLHIFNKDVIKNKIYSKQSNVKY